MLFRQCKIISMVLLYLWNRKTTGTFGIAMKYSIYIMYCLFVLLACKKEATVPDITDTQNQTILQQLAGKYEQLPEKAISQSTNKRVYAQYAMPSNKYKHGILGDEIEATQLVVVSDSVFFEYKLPVDYVFEDIRPRLYDVDGDNNLEFITIRTHVSKGAGIAIYKLVGGQLVEYAHVPEIGTAYRWLNIVAINDLDKDGIVELVWIETPHIGGIIKVAKIKSGTLQVLSAIPQYSNHDIGSRNLCLSVLTNQANKKVFYVPNQNRNKIAGFGFNNNTLELVEELNQLVDFSKPLVSQYTFSNIVVEENNCITAN